MTHISTKGHSRHNVGLLVKFETILPINSQTPLLSLGEGNTPLVKSSYFGKLLDCEIYFKLEGCNPTGSFKDRGMVLAVAKAAEQGKKVLICASTGNTSASAAAYGVKFGFKTLVLLPQGKIAFGKLLQASMFGAILVKVSGNFDSCLQLVREVATIDDSPIALVNSVNPMRIEGQKTVVWEVHEQLGRAPDIHCLPVGNAGNIVAHWKGYSELAEKLFIKERPKMWGIQAENAAPIVLNKVVENPETFATAIRIGNPASWEGAKKAIEESNGHILAVSDDDIAAAYLSLARKEGIFCEPASAASLAGLLKMNRNGTDMKGKTVVCTLTGNGLKDPNSAEKLSLSNFDEHAIEPKLTNLTTILDKFI